MSLTMSKGWLMTVSALCWRVLMTPNLWMRGWFESNARYWSVWVGLRYTLVRSLLLSIVMRQSRKGKELFDDFSCVNLMLLSGNASKNHRWTRRKGSASTYRTPGTGHFNSFLTVSSDSFNNTITPHSPDEVHRLWMKRCEVSKISSIWFAIYYLAGS